MATYTFDGTSSITAAKGDTVFISADPTTFTQATDNGTSVTLAFGSQTLTITGTTLAAGNLPNVYVSGGQFAYAGSTTPAGTGNIDTPTTTGNVLSFLVPTGGSYTVPSDTAGVASSTASSKIAIFGGLGRSDSIDGADSIVIGGKGTTLVYSDGGNDTITQVTAFDSTSTVNVYADGGVDSVILTAANTKASIFVSAGTDSDVVSVANSGATTIFGGLDSSDGNDAITLMARGDSTTANGSLANIYGNGGADSITVSGLDSTGTTNVFGGFGNDSISVTGYKSAVTVIGGEGSDTISVNNALGRQAGGGSIFITGGNPNGDQSLDGGDSITIVAGRNEVAVYGNLGNDTINLTGKPDDANINIYAGKDNDIVTVGTIPASSTGGTASSGIEESNVFVAGGEGSDTISIGASDSVSTITVYGGVSASDSADAADSISIATGAQGTINVFGNGGADSIQIGTLAADSVHTATVYGGGDADSISVAAQINGREALVLNGNEGADTFAIAKGTGLTVTVADFAIGSGGDKLALTGLTGGSPGSLQVVAPPSGGFQTLQQALDAASAASGGSNTQNKAAAVVFGGNTYVVIETGTQTTNGVAGSFQAGNDQAIKLTGVTDLVSLVGQTTISGA